MIPLGTKVNTNGFKGTVVAVTCRDGERYYMVHDGRTISLVPADVLESAK